MTKLIVTTRPLRRRRNPVNNQGEAAGGPLWAAGEITLRVEGTDQTPDRVVRVPRPFALLGQATDCDVCLTEPTVSARHVYLHLDARGLYAVDLLTRAGIRLDGNDPMAGWLQVGQGLEVAGRRIEVVDLKLDGRSIDPLFCAADPLSDTDAHTLVSVTLEPKRGIDAPWTLSSELAFLGWSDACAIPIQGPSVAKVHCVVLRTPETAYVIDLRGHHTRIDDRPVRGAAPLANGQTLMIGATAFRVRIEPPAPAPSLPALRPGVLTPEIERRYAGALPLELVPADSQRAVLSWMMDIVRESQSEILRQQGEMQTALVQLFRQVQHDNTALLSAQLARIENIDRELVQIRAELARREVKPEAAAYVPPAPPQVEPLRVERKSGETPSATSATWLMERLGQLENENRSARKDLLNWLSSSPKNPV